MTIRKKLSPALSPAPDPSAFISAAPDAAKPKAAAKAKVELFLDQADLARLDAVAARTGEKRASFIRRVVLERLNAE
ncbi:hypothetical protein [Neomegalonema perideroedes]|uniref:hypothetical protein n=1 Tax=Neomegalonema perideroedes TaxID=217219 RepID=UPI00036F111D|nr:hypothetical protein [Neomegalonema perideroedes]